ncbi:hypothetical protein ACLOCA_08660 [Limosilactobacillus fermentum]|uniref:hypothetical protein n=1 Tax=Limosilactobacillus fermentum TaxID=1613 RepID=UPI003EBA45AB
MASRSLATATTSSGVVLNAVATSFSCWWAAFKRAVAARPVAIKTLVPPGR